MIDRYLLRYLLAVVEAGSFSRAARNCGVSQPSLSVGIAKLEAELGQSLLLRTNRRVEVTPAGNRLAEHARRIEREFALAELAAKGTGVIRTLRVGMLSSFPAAWVERCAGTAAREVPDERLELVIASERVLLGQLDRGRLDAVLGVVRPDRARLSEGLFEEGYRLAMASEHALAGREVVGAPEVGNTPMIVRRHCEALPDVSRHFTALGLRPFIAARTTSDDLALALVRSGVGMTVMPAGFVARGVALVRLENFDLTRAIGLMHDRALPDARRSPMLALLKREIVAATQASR